MPGSLITIETSAILFDNDGVIVSSIAGVNRCWRRWAEYYEVPDWAGYKIPHGMRASDIIRVLRPDIDPAEGLRRIEDMEIEDVDDLEVLPGVEALLASLPAERWAVVTSATLRLLEARFRAAGLTLPPKLVTSEMVERGKPDPEPYRRGAELLGFAPEQCLVIEDAPSGVQAGVAAGCQVLGVLGTHTAEELRAAGASSVVRSLELVRAKVSNTGVVLEVGVERL